MDYDALEERLRTLNVYSAELAADAIADLRARNDALVKVLTEVDGLAVMEINPSNYDHDDVCELSRNASYASVIVAAALAANKEG